MPDAQPGSLFTVQMEVRDHELDMQGVVNNAVYQNYLEHARHQFLKAHGLDFAAITTAGIRLVVTRIEIDYLRSLRSGDRFVVSVEMERVSRLRFQFQQKITRDADDAAILRAIVVGTGLDSAGRPRRSLELEHLLTSCSANPSEQ